MCCFRWGGMIINVSTANGLALLCVAGWCPNEKVEGTGGWVGVSNRGGGGKSPKKRSDPRWNKKRGTGGGDTQHRQEVGQPQTHITDPESLIFSSGVCIWFICGLISTYKFMLHLLLLVVFDSQLSVSISFYKINNKWEVLIILFLLRFWFVTGRFLCFASFLLLSN